VSEFDVRDLELVNDSVSARAKHRCTVTVYPDIPEWTVTSPECTAASGQRGMAGRHSGWWAKNDNFSARSAIC